jgi:Beta-lactamase superfamily domain
MELTFYALARFRLEMPEVSIVTDPYTPGMSGFEPIDLVIMNSATDRLHSDPRHVRGQPIVVNTL